MRLNLVDRREASAIHVHAGHILVADKHRTLNTGWRSVPLELIRRYSRGDQRLCLSCSAGSNQRQHRKEDVSLHIVRPPITPCLADLALNTPCRARRRAKASPLCPARTKIPIVPKPRTRRIFVSSDLAVL